jgi:OFA family oxalate/formate antiporter-like MFS transporter
MPLKTTLEEQYDPKGKTGTFVYYGWLIIVSCVLIGIVSYGIRFSYGVFFKSIEADFGLNRTATSGVQSLFLLLGCVIAPLGGLALDRFGPKKIFVAAGAVTAAALVLTSRVTSLWQMYLTYSMLAAVGTSAINSMLSATAARWFTRKRGLAVGIATASGSLGMMAAPLIAYIIATSGWQTAYLILGLVAAVVWVPSALLLRRHEAPSATRSGVSPDSGRDHSISLKKALRYGPFWLLFFSWLLQSFCIFLVATHIVPYATDIGIDPARAASLITAIGASGLVGRIVMGRMADVKSKRGIAVFTMLLWGSGILGLIWAANLFWLYVCTAVIGFGTGGINPAMVSIFGEIFGMRHIGAILGAIDTSFGLGAAIGPALAGFIFDVRHSYTLAFLAGGLAIAVSLSLFLAVRVPSRRIVT